MKKINRQQILLNHLNIIQEAIDSKRNLVVFVGAGVSANSGAPTWKQLMQIFADDLGIDLPQSLDYLRFAQCYYNKHPQKYQKFLNEQLNRDWDPNAISKFLFQEYHPKYFITTNYDCILEKTALILNDTNYRVVCCNEDIPLIKDRAIIKMHGDFNNINIVLKESDYNEYSHKFKLVETFVKSVFATSVVIFVGFSADDPNVNQLYQWVKDILKEKQNPAYLIQIDNNISKAELKKQKILDRYFEQKGIYTINYKEIKSLVDSYIKNNPLSKELFEDISTLNIKGQNLFKTLYYIKYSKSSVRLLLEERIRLLRIFNNVSIEEIGIFLFDAAWVHYRQNTLVLYGDKPKYYLQEILKESRDNLATLRTFLRSKNIVRLKHEKEALLEVDID